MYHNFKELKSWQLSRVIVLSIYKTTKLFPNDEKFGLISQMRRAAVSISSNIAEGCGRRTEKELIQFLHIALGSSYELETQLILSSDLEFIDNSILNNTTSSLQELQRILHGHIKSLENKINR